MDRTDAIRDLLATAKIVAVVGCSPNPQRDSHRVAAYLQRVGYRIIPVNPGHSEILGERAYRELRAIPDGIRIDVVDVFRRPEYVPAIVDAAIERGARALWLQIGVANSDAERRAADAGLVVVSNRCIKAEHRMRFGS
jgi:predicted CoA-binding protein